MGKIFYIMGKSSSGKDTIYRRLKREKRLALRNITGYTTRPMREGEEDGREYYFVDEAELERLEAEGKVIEKRAYTTARGIWYYFTVNDENIDLAHHSYMMVGTLESFRKVMAYYGEEIVVPIYIHVEDGERLIRAIKREKEQIEPCYEELCRRFLADSKDFSREVLQELNIMDYYENNDLQTCYTRVKRDIVQHMAKKKK